MYPVSEIVPFTYPYPRLAHSPSGAKNLDEWTESRRVATALTFPRSLGIWMGVRLGGAQVDLPSMKQMERQVYPSMQHCTGFLIYSAHQSLCVRGCRL